MPVPDAFVRKHMPKRLEKDDEDYFIRRVEETGGETYKFTFVGRRGGPDRLAGWPNGRHAFVELKSDEQSWGVQPWQARMIARMRSWGMDVRILKNRQQIDAFIAEMTA